MESLVHVVYEQDELMKWFCISWTDEHLEQIGQSINQACVHCGYLKLQCLLCIAYSVFNIIQTCTQVLCTCIVMSSVVFTSAKMLMTQTFQERCCIMDLFMHRLNVD